MLCNYLFVLKKGFSFLVTAVVFGVVVSVNASSQVWAAEYQCNPDKELYDKVGAAFPPLDIRKTVQNSSVSAATDLPAFTGSGRTNTQEMACALYLLNNLVDNLGITRFDSLRREILAACPGLTPVPCTDLDTVWQKVTRDTNGNNFVYRDAQGAGSLIGFANMTQGAAINEPIPTNLAYFWNDSIKNIPFANTALAADVQYDSLGGFVEAILSIWKVFRNLAYGILSVVMLTVGIMIMLRKKLPPQLTVTAQYALPKIIIAVVLITFSYPIVAVVAKGVWYLKDLVISVIAEAAGEEKINALFPVPVGTLYLLFKAKGYLTGGSGIVTSIFLGLTSLVAAVFWILVWLRAMFIYIKIVLSAVFGPIQFAMGVIPGNEKMTETWIKNLLANAVSIIAMYAYANVIVLILLLIITNPAPTTGSGSTASLIAVIFYPFFAIWGFYQAFKVPGVINNAIIGEQKPAGRK
jgi:hypothetical protein